MVRGASGSNYGIEVAGIITVNGSGNNLNFANSFSGLGGTGGKLYGVDINSSTWNFNGTSNNVTFTNISGGQAPAVATTA